MKSRFSATLLQLVITLLVCFTFSQIQAKDPPDSIKAITKVVPDSVSLANKVVYVDFWASWCGPCRRSFPALQETLTKYQSKGFAVVAVNVDRDRKAAEKFLKEVRVSFEVVYDPEGKLAELYGLEAMPTSYIYGRDGKLRASNRGYRPDEGAKLDSLIQSLLAEAPKK